MFSCENLLELLLTASWMDPCRTLSDDVNKERSLAVVGDKKPDAHETDGKLRNLLKKTYLKRWVGIPDLRGSEAEVRVDSEGNFSSKKFNNIDFARFITVISNCTTLIY